LAGKVGVARAILNRMASVYFPDGQEVDVPCRYLEPTRPNKYDKVSWQVESVCARPLCDVG
jgi:hypothetical protein